MINLVCLIQESFDKPEDQNKMNPPWHQNNPMKNLQSNPHSRVGVFHDLGNYIHHLYGDGSWAVRTPSVQRWCRSCRSDSDLCVSQLRRGGWTWGWHGESSQVPKMKKLTAKHRVFWCFLGVRLYGKRHGKWLCNTCWRFQPLWKIWKSLGMMIWLFPIYGKIMEKKVPNHQSEY